MADPWAWQKYNKRRGVSNGMSIGTGGGNIGIADYLSENFDNLGGGSLTPQQELTATQDAIRGGAAIKSPETSVTRTDPDFMRSITQAPDGSNYFPEKPTEIPPMLARQITDPTPPAPAKGSGIDPNMLVRSQGDAQSRGSNLANPMPRREDFRRREALARQMEDDAIKLGGNKGAKFWGGDLVTESIAKKMAVAQQLRQGDDADYKESLNQYFIMNPDQHAEWERRTKMEKKIIPRFAPVNAVNPKTRNLVRTSEYGDTEELPNVQPLSVFEGEQTANRMLKDDERAAAEEKLNRALKREIANLEHSASVGKTDAQNRATAARLAQLQGLAPEAVEYAGKEEDKIANRHPQGREAGYLAQGFVMVDIENDDGTTQKVPVRPKKVLVPRPGQAAAPATGAKGAAPAKGGGVKWGRDANGKPIPIGG